MGLIRVSVSNMQILPRHAESIMLCAKSVWN